MPNINLCVFAGHLTRQPDMKYAASGSAIAHFGLAVNNRKKDKDGEWKNVPLFLDCVCFGRTAEFASEHLSKGDATLVQGRVELDSWTGQDGEKRTKLCLVADRVDSLASRGERKETPQEPEAAPAAASDAGSEAPF